MRSAVAVQVVQEEFPGVDMTRHLSSASDRGPPDPKCLPDRPPRISPSFLAARTVAHARDTGFLSLVVVRRAVTRSRPGGQLGQLRRAARAKVTAIRSW